MSHCPMRTLIEECPNGHWPLTFIANSDLQNVVEPLHHPTTTWAHLLRSSMAHAHVLIVVSSPMSKKETPTRSHKCFIMTHLIILLLFFCLFVFICFFRCSVRRFLTCANLPFAWLASQNRKIRPNRNERKTKIHKTKRSSIQPTGRLVFIR